MHRYFKNGTEAFYAEKESAKAKEILDQLVDTIEQLDDENTELTEERDQLQIDYDDAVAKLEAYDPHETLKLLEKLNTIGAAMCNYAVETERTIRRVHEIPYPDSGSGAGSDGSSEGGDDSTAGQEVTEGVTRPQIP